MNMGTDRWCMVSFLPYICPFGFGIKDGEVQYTGIAKQIIDARLSQNNVNGKGFQQLEE